MNLTLLADMGPSPRKHFLRDWQVALVEGNWDFIADHLTDDVSFYPVSEEPIHGKAAFLASLKARMDSVVEDLLIHHIITHGREGMLSGERRGEKNDAFCHVFTFKNTTANAIRSLRSYVVPV